MSIAKLLEFSRAKLTPEQLEAMRERIIESNKKFDKMIEDRFRCRICGADTYNYSHTLTAPDEGVGFNGRLEGNRRHQ